MKSNIFRKKSTPEDVRGHQKYIYNGKNGKTTLCRSIYQHQ